VPRRRDVQLLVVRQLRLAGVRLQQQRCVQQIGVCHQRLLQHGLLRRLQHLLLSQRLRRHLRGLLRAVRHLPVAAVPVGLQRYVCGRVHGLQHRLFDRPIPGKLRHNADRQRVHLVFGQLRGVLGAASWRVLDRNLHAMLLPVLLAAAA
jgi:hypothetical protein